MHSGEPVRYCDFIISSEGERGVLIYFGYLKRIKKMIMEEGKRWLGKASFTILSVMFLMDWFELNVFDVTGVVLLIGFVGNKLKDSGYDWTDYDWNQKDPLKLSCLDMD
ncbi:hypothetical protein CEXT_602041 [Caerostris extrusa]|uniref:Uncharacterized protein n=1 Tax=Caerostris extrusa TaxID=172846 RepID=A0AAV4PYB9_CAEEX|nr:hypothetical protein CEXT_602041 [Caerostris extrusa]